jgi:hypothetical protein
MTWTKGNHGDGGAKGRRIQSELASFRHAVRPRHAYQCEPFSREWFERCDQAFSQAMRNNPSERPSGRGTYNGAGSGR